MTTLNTTVQGLISRLIQREGGYVNHKKDRGGPTNMGVTIKTLSAWRGKPCTAADVEMLTDMEAREIYHEMYWIAPKFHELDLSSDLIEMIFDAGVHHGPGRAVKLLQLAARVKADGVIGPGTRAAVARINSEELAAGFIAERVAFIGKIITKDPSQAVFAEGWLNRMKEFILAIPQPN